jgi:PTS system nitrogen regulatory IIA component
MPVHALFTLISPTVRAHLHLLSRLAFLLRRAEIKDLIARQASRDEILEHVRAVEASLEPAAAAGKGGAAP